MSADFRMKSVYPAPNQPDQLMVDLAFDVMRRKRRHDRQKARDEFRDDIRRELARHLNTALLRSSASLLVEEAIKKVVQDRVDNGRMEQVIRKVIREEIDATLNKDSKSFVVGNSPFRQMLDRAIKEEFATYARNFINNNLRIQAIDGTGTPGAGSF